MNNHGFNAEKETALMLLKRLLLAACICVLFLSCCCGALAQEWEPLPMDGYDPGNPPADGAFLSDTEYRDDSISVKIYADRYAATDYLYVHVKISHPSQLRTAPATLVENPANKVNFRYTSEITKRGRYIANAANAVVAINGDYFIKTDKCQVVMRQSQQVRNAADGHMDLLVIDKNGDFTALEGCTRAQYNEYLDSHQADMYNVFCFGPVLARDGACVIGDDYYNGYLGSNKGTQRTAIAQLGPLEYMLITCSSEQASENKKVKDKGMTIQEFAQACEIAGKRLNENGCLLAFNLDGGNSATLNFKQTDPKTGKLNYVKVNPGQERFLSDIIYFATLVK